MDLVVDANHKYKFYNFNLGMGYENFLQYYVVF